jgi:predicted patatin/cPLA2 family phospholipase
MRGAFTSGVLQLMHSEGIRFGYIAGVSAGVLTALSFISDQPRRNYDTFVKYAPDPRYVSVGNLARTGSIFGFDFMFGELVDTLLPFDFDAFFSSSTELMIGTTDIESGKPIFYRKSDLEGDKSLMLLRATASLPLVSNIVRWRGKKLLDGGISCPIPIEQSIADGNEYNVIVLTRDKTTDLKPTKMNPLLTNMYRDYPELLKTISLRHEIYRRQREYIYELEERGKAIVIRPSRPVAIGRYEKNPEKLAALHDTAMIDCYPQIAAIKEMIKKHG